MRQPPIPKKIPHFTDPVWSQMVKFRLSFGMGVEDISLQMKCSADDVRFFVRKLRSDGELCHVYEKMRRRMRNA